MKYVHTDRQGEIAYVWLTRPQLHNAFDDILIAELTRALERCDADAGIRAVVLTGEGATFSAGADLNWMRRMAAASEADNLTDSQGLARLMRT
ncbi:MAG TPA: enoyl-CoA hydratase-related protein, partial [Arenimonas sp.]|nr:enoyl-CoA hydratase-related protein [Arenimonas sp.]